MAKTRTMPSYFPFLPRNRKSQAEINRWGDGELSWSRLLMFSWLDCQRSIKQLIWRLCRIWECPWTGARVVPFCHESNWEKCICTVRPYFFPSPLVWVCSLFILRIHSSYPVVYLYGGDWSAGLHLFFNGEILWWWKWSYPVMGKWMKIGDRRGIVYQPKGF